MSTEIAVSAERPEHLDFRLLGSLQLIAGGHPRALGPEQEQRMLVALLAAMGTPVTHGRLMEAIWDDQPDGALDALYHLARGLRRRLETVGYAGVLTGVNGTYRLGLPVQSVDVHRFHALVSRARQAAGADDRRAVDLIEEALRLHRGQPLAGLRGRWVDSYRHTLLEERHAAELALYEISIRQGESRERLPGLYRLYRERPEDEWVAWLLMHALYRAGRQEDALAVRREVASHLDKTIAAASLKALADLYERILRHDEELLRPEALSFPAGEAGTRARVLGRPGPRAHEDGGGQQDEGSMGQATRDTSAGAGQAGPDRGEWVPPIAHTSIVINGSVNAGRDSVIGTSIGTQNNYGGSR